MHRLLANTSKIVRAQRSLYQTRSFAAGKDLMFGTEARKKIMNGVEKISSCVAVTLGPKGRNVAIEQSYGAPKITKDGVTVAKAIDFADPYENIGAQLVKNVASKTNDLAGDGTTTATILTRALFVEGSKAVAAGMNPMDLKRGMDQAVEHVVKFLQKIRKEVTTTEEIKQVATISANGDETIGNLLAVAMEKVTKQGTITIQDGKGLETEVEIIEGMNFDQGVISRYFFTDAKSQVCEFDDPLILLYDGKINSVQVLIPLLEKVAKARRRLLIIAENVEAEALSTLILNKLRGLEVSAVKAPGFGDARANNLQDIAILTGGQLISEETGTKLEDVDIDMLGKAKKVKCTADNTIILDGGGRKEDIKERGEMLYELMAKSTSAYDKEKLQERIARLTGGVAVVKVGGASEVEVGEKKDRITDALNATRAAVQEGIVPGGGVALLYASRSLESLKEATKKVNFDQGQGIQIVQDALKSLTRTIAQNAGVEGSVVIEKLLGQDNHYFGYNAQTGEYVDMMKAGVVDPLLTSRVALQDAASVASLLTTTEAVIVSIPEPEKAPAMPPGGGMGGYGGGMF